MKNFVSLFFGLVFLMGCAQGKQDVKGDTRFQREINSEYKDASKSPLKSKDLKNFSGLDFFKFDTTYVVTATLKRTPNTEYFDMQTTTSRVSKERIFGILTFMLNDEIYNLNVYQNKDLITEEGSEDYLFLPFLDDTNGDETYGGGRYIDLRIPTGDMITIDFNSAYNPYCAYNEKYSCPIVPRENYVGTNVRAGVKAFVK